VFESDIPVPNVAQMQTRAARADRAGVDLRRLVADAVPRSLVVPRVSSSVYPAAG
jgi:hypothetical protein